MASVLFLVLFVAIFFPSRGHLRAEYPLLAFLLFYLLLRQGFGILRRTAAEQICLFLFVVSGLLSIISFAARSDRFVYQDVLTLARGPVYGLIIAVASSIVIRERQMHRFVTVLLWMGAAAAAVSVIQYYNVGGLNATFLQLYREDTAMSTGSSYWDNFVYMSQTRRVIGTSGNPNDWGLILSFFCLLSTYKIIFERRLVWIPLSAALLVAIITSGSRTAVIGVVGALGAGLVVATQYGRIKLANLLGALSLLAPVLLGSWLFYTTQFENQDRFTTRDLGSMQQRIVLWGQTLERYKDTLMLGQGPAKALRVRGSLNAKDAQVRDNVFVSFFVQFGLVGVAVLSAFMFAMYRRLLHEVRSGRHAVPWWPVFMFSVFVSWLLFGMTADSFFGIQVNYVTMLLYGITLAAPKKARELPSLSSTPETMIDDGGRIRDPLFVR